MRVLILRGSRAVERRTTVQAPVHLAIRDHRRQLPNGAAQVCDRRTEGESRALHELPQEVVMLHLGDFTKELVDRLICAQWGALVKLL